MAKAEYRHCQNARCHAQVLRKDGSMSAVTLGVGLGSLTHRDWHPSSTAVGDPQLRQSYITPHCPQCPPVSRKLLLWRPPLRALRVKATGLMQNCLRWSGRQPPALPGRFAPYVQSSVALLVCGHLGISQALRAGGFGQWPAAMHLVCAPPTLGACLLRSIARAVCPSAPKGLPAVPRRSHAA